MSFSFQQQQQQQQQQHQTQHGWPPPHPLTPSSMSNLPNALLRSSFPIPDDRHPSTPQRTRTPVQQPHFSQHHQNPPQHPMPHLMVRSQSSQSLVPEASDAEDDHRRAHFASLLRRFDDRISSIYDSTGAYNKPAIAVISQSPFRPTVTATATATPTSAPGPGPRPGPVPHHPLPTTDHTPIREPPRKKARVIDDDYDDYDDDDEDEEEDEPATSQRANIAAANSLLSPSKSGSSPVHSDAAPPSKPLVNATPQSLEETRKQLEDEKTAIEERAVRSFYTMFHTLENDRIAMVEQEKLDESEQQIQAEMDKNQGTTTASGPNQNQGTLSSANLGTSSLTLKHLIARIDAKRDMVRASDTELRSLMNEVRRNRSKWANEEQVGQEELYEALEKVLSDLRALTPFSTPFLSRVNKRDAPDYYSIIKHPMDLGTMMKKLKQYTFKSKADFVNDLNLIWDNCLKYNHDLSHPLRRMATGMRKEAHKIIPLIPDIVIRPRAEVEAEERRKQLGGDDEDSDDEPIMSSRGRTAGGKKGTTKSRKGHEDKKESTPNPDQKPALQLNGLLAKSNREGSEARDGSNGLGTPPVGSITPCGMNGQSGSNVDAMDIDGPSMTLDLPASEQAYEDDEYKVWKQITKKDRARITKDRYQMFKGDRLNPEAPALLRTRAGMRKHLKRKRLHEMGIYTLSRDASNAAAAEAGGDDAVKAVETLAEGIEAQDEEESLIPDYYEPQHTIPDIHPRLQWHTDADGQINQHEEYLKMIPPGYFTAPQSTLVKRMDSNLHQMQETRKMCSKITVIKQMAIQAQVYSNQFSTHHPVPFVEEDIAPQYYCGDLPVIAPETSRGALQRSVSKIFYHAGFEEMQPSALDAITEVAADYMARLVKTFNTYREAEKMEVLTPEGDVTYVPRFTQEETILHTLANNGTDVEALESYVRDDIDRLGNKLGTIHDRMKTHLADLLRPALANDAGADGAGAFNDGSEQFVSGDFAEELGDDFFGFRELGLDVEMGLDVLSVPLHLLQTRVRRQFHQAQVAGPVGPADVFEELPALPVINKETAQSQVGLAKDFFLVKLETAKDGFLVQDADLPVKQRRPRPRLGPSGKIVGSQKKPPREQIALAKKRKKLEMLAKEGGSPDKKRAKIGGKNGGGGNVADPMLTVPMSRGPSLQSQVEGADKEDVAAPISPESMGR